MCGIAGYHGRQKIDRLRIEKTLGLMKRRGPDNRNWQSFAKNDSNTYLLHARLSIIDPDPRANQPFSFGEKVIVQNGELYNYIEVGARLEKQGEKFATKSDTEVLIKALTINGESALDKMEGMWAFAMYDKTDGSLMLCRDRFGEKPLYLLHADEGLYFGSEIKFIKALSGRSLTPNRKMIERYLVHGYKSLYKKNESFYEDIEQVPAASVLKISTDGDKNLRRYWTPAYAPENSMSRDQAVKETRKLLKDAVRIRLRSDVPVAFCMSGGVDSNGLISIAAKEFGFDVHGFTVMNVDKDYDEKENVEAAVKELGVRHTKIPVTTKNFLGNLQKIVEYHDEPVHTISYYAQWLLLKAVSEHGYKVSISGTGADEIFTGYYDHYLMYLAEVQGEDLYEGSLLAWQKHVAPVVRNRFLQSPETFIKNRNLRDHIFLDAEEIGKRLRSEFTEKFTEQNYCESLLRNRMMNEMFHETVPSIIHEDDMNAMYFSIENRSPFLDRALYDFAFTIPTRHLQKDGYNKSILRDAIRGIAPDRIVNSRKKIGFNAPIDAFLDLGDTDVHDWLMDDSAVYDIVKKESIEKLIGNDKFPNSESKFLFYFINVKIFLEMQKTA